uniref:ATP synthase complex subunit 8 n=1 Tax=Epicauta emmerichi TaxID=2880900 RepID=A0A8K1MDA1_9CUCU|nr:ATP synthase F0 subunit 8 [Epicauta emmerichi]UBU96206.1 ATP synthase F0 subunit 8 [Epicauta emmerichi]
MPQMAPLNWLTLLIFFMAIYILVNSMNFYSFSYSLPMQSSLMKSTIKMNWKWL